MTEQLSKNQILDKSKELYEAVMSASKDSDAYKKAKEASEVFGADSTNMDVVHGVAQARNEDETKAALAHASAFSAKAYLDGSITWRRQKWHADIPNSHDKRIAEAIDDGRTMAVEVGVESGAKAGLRVQKGYREIARRASERADYAEHVQRRINDEHNRQ